MSVKVSIEKDELVIRVPLEKKPAPSGGGTGKNLVIATTRGFASTEAKYEGKDVRVSINAIVSKT